MEDNYWKQFVCTGSVKDYLQYCRAKNQMEQEAPKQGKQDDGEHYGDGDDSVGPADRGV